MGVRSKREYVISVHCPIENRRDRAAHSAQYVINESVITRFYCMFQSPVLYARRPIIEHENSVPVEMPGPRLQQHEGIWHLLCLRAGSAPRHGGPHHGPRQKNALIGYDIAKKCASILECALSVACDPIYTKLTEMQLTIHLTTNQWKLHKTLLPKMRVLHLPEVLLDFEIGGKQKEWNMLELRGFEFW
jgi:hypothetical protein